MIPNDQPARKEMVGRMLAALVEWIVVEEDKYTEWECDFIGSVHNQFMQKGDLSNKQCEILERIYDK